MTRLPAADLEAFARQRREAANKAAERRLERERELAAQAVAFVGEDDVLEQREFRGQITLVVRLGRIHDIARHMKEALGFAMYADGTAFDYLKLEGDHPERFAVSYLLRNLERNAQICIQAYVDEDDPVAPTLTDLWPAANWAEREIYDMYGIEFEGHPNLIRLLLPQEYSGYPLRKDYPLRGRGERDNFPVIRRGQEDLA